MQKKDANHVPLLRPEHEQAIHLDNVAIATFRPIMKNHYYDPNQYGASMDQLGITYPTVRER